ncbi:hypothetical protein Tco_0496681, partial [Tanacetum coccineum]
MPPPLATVNIPFASMSPNSNIATTSLERMKEGFLDSGGGGGKKKKSNSNDSLIDAILVSADGDELNEALGTNPVSSTPKVFNEVGMHDVGTGPTTLTPNPGQSSSYVDVT